MARWERVRACLGPDGVFINGWYQGHLQQAPGATRSPALAEAHG